MSGPTPGERIAELEDALEQCMGIWEGHLNDGNSKAAGAEIIRVVRLASLRKLADGTTLDEVRAISLKELRHKVLALEATLDTAREMLREWNPTPLADTLRLLEDDLEGTLTEDQKADIEAARVRLAAVPTLQWADDISEIDLLRKLVGIQKLRQIETGNDALEEYMAKERRRMGSGGGKCPGCGYDLLHG